MCTDQPLDNLVKYKICLITNYTKWKLLNIILIGIVLCIHVQCVCVCACMCVCVCVCMHTCMCVYVFVDEPFLKLFYV